MLDNAINPKEHRLHFGRGFALSPTIDRSTWRTLLNKFNGALDGVLDKIIFQCSHHPRIFVSLLVSLLYLKLLLYVTYHVGTYIRIFFFFVMVNDRKKEKEKLIRSVETRARAQKPPLKNVLQCIFMDTRAELLHVHLHTNSKLHICLADRRMHVASNEYYRSFFSPFLFSQFSFSFGRSFEHGSWNQRKCSRKLENFSRFIFCGMRIPAVCLEKEKRKIKSRTNNTVTDT